MSSTEEVEAPVTEEVKRSVRDLPWRGVAVLCLGNVAHFYSICSLFSYAGFLCVDNGWTESRDSAGFVAGWLGTALTLGRLPSAVAWGWLSDRVGRRPTMLASFFFIGLGNVLFGLSKSLKTAVLVRFVVLGTLNGWTSLFPSVLNEIAGSELQNDVSALVLASGAATQLVGPAAAALLYGRGFSEYKALAPSLLGAGFAFLAFAAGFAWLPETNAALTTKNKDSVVQQKVEVHQHSLRGNSVFRVGVLMRVLVGLALFAVFDTLPLWAIASKRSGGLELDKNQLAMLLSIAAVAQFFYVTTCMARSMRPLGNRRSFQLATGISGLAVACLPVVGALHVKTWATILASAVFVMCFYSGGSVTFASACAIVNDSVPTARRGTANGITTMFEAVGKSVGPTLGPSVLAWGLTRHPGFLGAASSFWLLAAILFIACATATFGLDRNDAKNTHGDESLTKKQSFTRITQLDDSQRGAFSILGDDDDDDEDDEDDDNDDCHITIADSELV